MALASATHSDDEYGWDLSREEEEELFAIIDDTTFSPTNATETPRNFARRAADSPESRGSSSTVRTALRRPIASLPGTAPAEAHALKVDTHAAFPRSPRTVAITDNDNISEIESLGRRSPHRNGEDTPAYSRSAVYRGSKQAQESPEDDEPLSPGSYVAEEVSYPDSLCASNPCSIRLRLDIIQKKDRVGGWARPRCRPVEREGAVAPGAFAHVSTQAV